MSDKIKKILCVVLLITMCIPNVSFAVDTNTYTINENFDSSTGTLKSNVDAGDSITFSGNGLSNNLTFTSNTVKDAVVSVDTHPVKGRKSLKYSVTSNRVGLYINRSETAALSGNINFEFSFMAENTNQTAVQITAKDSSANQWATIANNSFLVARDGKIYLNYQDANNKGKELASYEAGKWYHAVFCVDTATASYMLYLNNEEVFSKTTTANTLIRSDLKELKLMISPEANSSVWLDDVKVYTTQSFGYDAVADGAECSVTSTNENYIIDEDSVSVPYGTTINDLLDEESGLSFPSDDISFFSISNVTIEPSSYDKEISEAIKIIARSENGVVVKEYIASVPDESNVLISSESLTIDNKNGTISEVDPEITKDELLAAVTPPHEDAVIEIVDASGNSYNADSLTKNLSLKVTSADGKSSKLYSIVFKATFFSDTVCLLLESGNFWINDEKTTAQMPVVMVGNSVMLPVETLAEIAGEELAETSNIVEIGNCSFVIGESKFSYGGREIQLAEKIQKIDGTVYIPLKEYVTEVLGKHYSLSQKGLIVIGNDSQTSVQGTENADKAMQMLNYLAYDRPDANALKTTVLNNSHPRAFAKTADFEAAIERISTNDTLKAWSDKVISSADWILEKEITKTDTPGQSISGHVYNDYILNLYWAYKVTGETKYAAKAEAFALNMAEMSHWEADFLFLTTEAVCISTALVYDLFNDYLSDDSKEIIAEAIKNNALVPAQEYYNSTASSAWPKRDTNWNIVCNSGVIVGAIAIMDAYPELCADVLEKAIASLENAMHSFSPDGGWFEGVGYWEYTVEDMVMALAALETACGTTYGITEIPGVMDTAYFPIYLSGNPYAFGFSDIDPNTIVNTAATMWFANKTQDMNLQKYRMEQISSHGSTSPVKDLIWYSEKQMPSQAEFNLDAIYSSADVATMRSDWSSDAIIANIHAGENDVAHGQLDIGDFEYEVWGTKFADEMCKDDYALDGYFDIGGQRNDYYVNRAEGQNVYVINPSEDGGQKTNASSEIVMLQGNSTDSIYTIDMTPAYANNVESALRGFMLSEDRKVFTVQDEIIPKNQDDEYYWYWHTKSEITIGEDRKTLTLTDVADDSKTVKLYIDCNVDFDITKGKAVPTSTSPNPEGQLEKPHHLAMNKITVNFLSDAEKVTLRVTAVPCDVSFVPGDVKPIEQWGSYNNENDTQDTITYAINENFNKSEGTLTSNVDNWKSITFYGTGLDNGLTFTSNTVKDAVVSVGTHPVKGDKSLKYSVTSNRLGLYINRSEATALSGNINFEFSFMAENINQTAVQITAKDSSSNVWGTVANNSFLVARDGKIYLNYQNADNKGKELASYEAGKWYHAVFCVDTATASYMLYLNNEEVFSKTTTANTLIRSDLKELKLMISPEANSSVWLDDVKLYSPSEFGYDAKMAGNECYIESTYNNVVVDSSNAIVTITDDITMKDIEALRDKGFLSFSNENVSFIGADGEEILKTQYNEPIEEGSKFYVRSKSGAAVKEYSVIVNEIPAESKTIVTSDAFAVDKISKVITDIEFDLTVSDVISGVKLPHEEAELSIVNDSKEPYQGTELTTGLYLKVTSADENFSELYSLDYRIATIELPVNIEGITRNKNVEIGIKVMEDVIVESVKFYIDGEEIQGNSEKKVEYTFESEKTVEIYAIVTTSTETIMTSVKKLEYKTNTVPVAEFVSLTDGYETEEKSLSVKVKAIDDDGSIEKLRLYVDGMLFSETEGSENTFELADLTVGAHFMYAEAIDNEGGVGVSDCITVYVKETYLTKISETDFSDGYDWTVGIPTNHSVSSGVVTDDNADYGKCFEMKDVIGTPYFLFESSDPMMSNADITLEMDVKVSDVQIILKMFSINTTEGDWINSSGFEIINGLYGDKTVLTADTWHHVKYTFNLRTAQHEFSIDGVSLKSGAFTYTKPTRTFKNIRIALNKLNDADSSLFVDNISIIANAQMPMLSSVVYLDGEGKKIIPANGMVNNDVKTVKLIFNNELVPENIAAETVKVYGLEGRMIDTDVKCNSESASEVLITLKEEVKSLCNYKIVVDEGIKDVYGKETLSDTVVSFETAPNSFDVTTWEIKQGSDTVNLSELRKGDTITLYATMENNTDFPVKNQRLVFTAISDNRMIGYTINDTWEIPANDSKTVSVTITLTEDFSIPPTLHGYLWDSEQMSNPIATRYLAK